MFRRVAEPQRSRVAGGGVFDAPGPVSASRGVEDSAPSHPPPPRPRTAISRPAAPPPRPGRLPGRRPGLFQEAELTMHLDLISHHEIASTEVLRNLAPARLYELALAEGATITSTGALSTFSGKKTGAQPAGQAARRQPREHRQRLVGPGQHPHQPRGVRHLPARGHRLPLGPRPRVRRRRLRRLGSRVPHQGPRLCAQAYHALFMHNMLIRPGPRSSTTSASPSSSSTTPGTSPPTSTSTASAPPPPSCSTWNSASS